MEHTVVCRNVGKVYHQDTVAVQALTDINLEIPKKDFVCLSGPSGSGKTTLLNLIGGLDRPTAGEILVDGNRVDQIEKGALAELRLRSIGFVFQAVQSDTGADGAGERRVRDAAAGRAGDGTRRQSDARS